MKGWCLCVCLQLSSVIKRLNEDTSVHGIIVLVGAHSTVTRNR